MILHLYKETVETEMVVLVVEGLKSESETRWRAAHLLHRGADGDGRALQAGTSHNLGQNFAWPSTSPFRRLSTQHVWGTSWGMTTRLIGAAIGAADDSGLCCRGSRRIRW